MSKVVIGIDTAMWAGHPVTFIPRHVFMLQCTSLCFFILCRLS